MFTIKAAQIEALKEEARLAYVDELGEHLYKFEAPLCKYLGKQRLEFVIKNGIDRAERYGFTYRGPVRLFLELMLLFGSGFDEDPQYPWAHQTLRRRDFSNQMFQAGRLEYLAKEYLEQVHGPGNSKAQQALLRLEDLARRPDLVFHRNSMKQDILDILRRIFPSKLDHIGIAAAEDIARRAKALSDEVFGQEHERAVAVLAILKFSFGVRCEDDPVYPWIGATLRNPRINDANFRAASLERKARLWLRAVNAQAKAAST